MLFTSGFSHTRGKQTTLNLHESSSALAVYTNLADKFNLRVFIFSFWDNEVIMGVVCVWVTDRVFVKSGSNFVRGK